MIILTNQQQTGNKYPCNVSGGYSFKILSTSSGTYSIRVFGLTDNYFDCEVDSSEVETNGSFDYDLFFAWIQLQMQETSQDSSGSSSSLDEITQTFVQINESTDEYEFNLGGSFTVQEVSSDSVNYYFRFHTVDGDSFDFTIEKTEDAVQYGIDPAKLLRWLLKKMKEALCPECL